jgi:acetyltransferase
MDAATPIGRILNGFAERHPETVFLAMALVGGHYFPTQYPDTPIAEPIDRLNGVPFLQGSEYGLKAVAALIRYAEFLRSRPEVGVPPVRSGRSVPRGRPLTERESKALLAEYGIPVTREHLCITLEQARVAAREIGYPVALKLEAPGLAHKTEAGAVKLNVGDPERLERAYTELVGLRVPDACGVLVQEMVPPGVEVLLGMTTDPQFGPVIAVGMGGLLVEVLEDVQLLLPPVSARDAREALGNLRGIHLLHGARGRPPANIEALVEAILNFSDACRDLQDSVREIDINPLIVLPDGVRAVDALVVPKVEGAINGPA